MERLVIVGASLAGLRAAQGARGAGWDGEVVVVGEEAHMPYTRPPLSKDLLGDPARRVEDHLFPVDLEATWLLGERATTLDRAGRRVDLAGGEQLAYGRLVVATGCAARRWRGPGSELGGVHTLRHVDDAIALREALAQRPRLAIVGAGFIGCEVAAAARAQGLEVTLIEAGPTPMPALGPLFGERCAELHRDHGVELRLGVGVTALRGSDGRVGAVELEDGSRVEADLVLVALGATPRTDWLEGSGLVLEAGVRCDATLSAIGEDDVLAAGDVAVWPHPLADGEPVRIEHWTNAAEQGSLAGRNATLPRAERASLASVPYFWSDQYDVKVQAVGLPRLARHWQVADNDDDGDPVALGERDGVLVAAVALGSPRRVSSYRRRIGGPFDLELTASQAQP